MIYLASPYSHVDSQIRHNRYQLAVEATTALLHQRKWVYSPIVHCHYLAIDGDLPTDFDFWRDYNFHILNRVNELFVLDIPGWKESKGVQAEIEWWFDNTSNFPYVLSPLGGGKYRTARLARVS